VPLSKKPTSSEQIDGAKHIRIKYFSVLVALAVLCTPAFGGREKQQSHLLELRHRSVATKSLYGLPIAARKRKIPVHAQAARANGIVIIKKNVRIRTNPTQKSRMAMST